MTEKCTVVTYGDRTVCGTCKNAWDTNDPNPPLCPYDPAARSCMSCRHNWKDNLADQYKCRRRENRYTDPVTGRTVAYSPLCSSERHALWIFFHRCGERGRFWEGK